MWGWMHGTGWGWGWGLPMIGMVLFWILLIAAVAWALRAGSDRPVRSTGPRAETPLEILQRRYAAGEIGRDEYEQKRRDLTS